MGNTTHYITHIIESIHINVILHITHINRNAWLIICLIWWLHCKHNIYENPQTEDIIAYYFNLRAEAYTSTLGLLTDWLLTDSPFLVLDQEKSGGWRKKISPPALYTDEVLLRTFKYKSITVQTCIVQIRNENMFSLIL